MHMLRPLIAYASIFRVDGSEIPRLAEARRCRGHTQQECSDELSRLAGISVSQPTVSKLETGVVTHPRVDLFQAVRIYVSYEALNSTPSVNASPTPTDPTTEPKPVAHATENAIAFDQVAQQLSGEPLLGPRQGAFLDAVTHRIRTGPPTTRTDLHVMEQMALNLGLSWSPPPR